MTCDELFSRLTDHEEGALQGDLCAAVEQHLGSCLSCQKAREELRIIARLCRQEAPLRLPDGVRQRIERLLDTAAPSSPGA